MTKTLAALLMLILAWKSTVRAQTVRAQTVSAQTVSAQNVPADPVTQSITRLAQQAIDKGDCPGVVILAADSKAVRQCVVLGHQQSQPSVVPMRRDTVFDLASITKPVATATAIALLQQQGKLSDSDPVSKHLPEFTGHGKENITIKQCLLHTSGLTPDNALSDYSDDQQQNWANICRLPLRSEPGSKFAYSDVGFIVLGKLIERVSGMEHQAFAAQHLYQPLQMSDTQFNPPATLKARVAPTAPEGDHWIHGRVHDPRAFRMRGVAGHAGLFSTADDLVLLGRELIAASKGQGKVFDQKTVQRMFQPVKLDRGSRSGGWDHMSPYSSNRGSSLSDAAVGHGGFTGTVFWVDPKKDLIFVFLSSRMHPDGKGAVNRHAGQIVTVIGESW
jgi:CubicO group peptidase (beta-lactamase class C family)